MPSTMNLVPSSKHDLEACANLAAATDDQVAPYAVELLEWLQDMNWPVARPVKERLARMGTRLVGPIRDVLKGDDEIWKFWLISSLLPSMSDEVVSELYFDLERIALHPTEGERSEEADVAAKDLLASSGRRLG